MSDYESRYEDHAMQPEEKLDLIILMLEELLGNDLDVVKVKWSDKVKEKKKL